VSDEPPGSGADHAYFRAIEEQFVRLRGSPLLLSPEDWRIASRWRRSGIPLELVQRSLEEVFARRRERDPEARVQSLKYCAPAVESAWRRQRELASAAVGGMPQPFEPAERLARLAALLPADLAAIGRRVVALGGSPEAIDGALAELDRELLRTAAAGLTAREREELEEGVERRLVRFAERVPAGELEESRRRLWETELRERLGLPVLSLFSPEARG